MRHLGSASFLSMVGFVVFAGHAACGGTDASDLVGDPTLDGSASGDASSTLDGTANADSTSGGDTGGGDVTADAAPCPDNDSDGVTTCAGDCDDGDRDSFPGNIDYCGDAKDNNCNSQADESCNGKGTYVSGETGNDNNAGTQAQPLKTIKKGIDNAKAIGGKQIVFVAGSHYPENVDLVEGISLQGGYLCTTASCTWARDPKANDTAILNQRPAGVVAGDSITSATRIDGFRIEGFDVAGAGALDTRAITCDGGSPTISNNTINGGNVTAGAGNRTSAVFVGAPTNNQQMGAIVVGNAIKGGNANGASTYGVMIARPNAGNPAIAQVSNNKIVGGPVVVAGISVGVNLNGSGAATTVFDNDVVAGGAGGTARTFGFRISTPGTVDKNRINVDQSAVGSCASAGEICGGGILVLANSVRLTNNVAFGVKAKFTAALSIGNPEGAATGDVIVNGNYLDGAGSKVAGSSSAAVSFRINGGTDAVVGKLRNNILMGGVNETRYGVYEEHTLGKTCHPEAFEHNDIFFAPQANTTNVVYHFDNGAAGTGTDRTLQQMEQNAIGAFTPSNNLDVDCFVSATFHLGASSPCANAGTAKEAAATDIDGEARPKSNTKVDIGPDEAE